MILANHEVGTGLLPDEYRDLAMVKRWILVKVGVLVAVYFDEKVPHDIFWLDCQQLWLGSFRPGVLRLTIGV